MSIQKDNVGYIKMENKIKEKNEDKTGKLELERLENRVLLSGIETAGIELIGIPEPPYEHPIAPGVEFSPYGCKLKGPLIKGTWEVSDGKLFIDLNTTEKSSFTIKGSASIGKMDAPWLKNFNAKYSDVIGEVNISNVKKVVLDDIYENLNIGNNKNIKVDYIKNAVVDVDSDAGKIDVRGSITNSRITLKDVKKLSIKGDVIESDIVADELLRKVDIKGNFKNSGLYFGYNPGLDGVPGGLEDTIHDTLDLASPNIKIKETMENSWIGTIDTFKKIDIGSVKTYNNGSEFGIFYDNWAGKLKIGGIKRSAPLHINDFIVDNLRKMDFRPVSSPPFL